MDIISLGYIGAIAYGGVGAITYILKRRNITLAQDQKFYLLVAFCILGKAIPPDLGNSVFNIFKGGVEAAMLLTAGSTALNKVGNK